MNVRKIRTTNPDSLPLQVLRILLHSTVPLTAVQIANVMKRSPTYLRDPIASLMAENYISADGGATVTPNGTTFKDHTYALTKRGENLLNKVPGGLLPVGSTPGSARSKKPFATAKTGDSHTIIELSEKNKALHAQLSERDAMIEALTRKLMAKVTFSVDLPVLGPTEFTGQQVQDLHKQLTEVLAQALNAAAVSDDA